MRARAQVQVPEAIHGDHLVSRPRGRFGEPSCGDASAQAAQGLLARHHVQMIEHASPRLANCQQLDELAMRAAGEPVRDQGRALRRLLRHRGEPLEHACGSERLEPPSDRPAHGLDPSKPPREHELGRPGHRLRECHGRFHGALDERLRRHAFPWRRGVRQPLGWLGALIPARDGGGAAPKQHVLRHAAREIGGFAVERTGGAQSQCAG